MNGNSLGQECTLIRALEHLGVPKALRLSLGPFLVFSCFLSGLVLAQRAAAQTSSQVERLAKALSGTWSIAINVEPSEHMPKGGKGRGEEVWKPGPGGLSLIEDYHSIGDEGEITGLGVAWWDENAQRYQVTWCDNGNPTGCILMKHGAKWVGNELVAMNEWEEGGKKFVFKEVFSDITPTSFKQSLYQGNSGGELKPLVVIDATRTNNASASEGPPKASPVQFPISCNAEAREPFNRALARLHSFCKD